jgi:hypothetical protein
MEEAPKRAQRCIQLNAVPPRTWGLPPTKPWDARAFGIQRALLNVAKDINEAFCGQKAGIDEILKS